MITIRIKCPQLSPSFKRHFNRVIYKFFLLQVSSSFSIVTDGKRIDYKMIHFNTNEKFLRFCHEVNFKTFCYCYRFFKLFITIYICILCEAQLCLRYVTCFYDATSHPLNTIHLTKNFWSIFFQLS